MAWRQHTFLALELNGRQAAVVYSYDFHPNGIRRFVSLRRHGLRMTLRPSHRMFRKAGAVPWQSRRGSLAGPGQSPPASCC